MREVKKEHSDPCGLFCLAVVQVRDEGEEEPSWLRKQHFSGAFKAGDGIFLCIRSLTSGRALVKGSEGVVKCCSCKVYETAGPLEQHRR